jgi:kynurenine formamidase
MAYSQIARPCNPLGAIAVLVLATTAHGVDVETARLVDLTHPFDETTIYWPTARPFELESVSHGHTPGGWWYAANNFCAAEHGGTHLDAPIHFAQGGLTADQIPLERLRGMAVVVDVHARAAADPDMLIRVRDLEADEAAFGRIPEGAIVLLRTGWARYWPDALRYLGTAARGDTTHLHFPGLSARPPAGSTARRVRAVGVDTASIDRGQSADFRPIAALAAANVPISRTWPTSMCFPRAAQLSSRSR